MLDRYLKTFIVEADEYLTEIDATTLAIEAEGPSQEKINQLFRAFHTIKGSAAICGLNAIAQFTHNVENVLDQVREGKIAVTPKLIDLILRSEDQIEALMVEAQGGKGPELHETQTLLRDLCALAGIPVENTSNSQRQRRGEEEDAVIF